MTRLRGCVLAVIACVLTAAGPSAFAEVAVSASLEPGHIHVGDRAVYEVSLRFDDETFVRFEDRFAEADGVELLDTDTAPPQKNAGHEEQRLRYTITSFETGEHALPEMRVVFSEDGEERSYPVPEQRITVDSVLPDSLEGADLRAIKAPMAPGFGWTWLLVLLAVGVAVLAVWLLSKRRGAAAGNVPDPVPAHERALEALQRLKNQGLIKRGLYEDYFVRLSGIVRVYVEERFALRAPDMTTEEFLAAAAGAEALSPDFRALLREFLRQCDLVKFARYRPSETEAEEAFEAARGFVEKTIPEPVESEAAGQ